MDKEIFKKNFETIRFNMPTEIVSALVSVLSSIAYVECLKPVSEKVRQEALELFAPKVEDGECGEFSLPPQLKLKKFMIIIN